MQSSSPEATDFAAALQKKENRQDGTIGGARALLWNEMGHRLSCPFP